MTTYDPRGFAVEYFLDGHDGPGWYYWDSEYPDEGSVGAFGTCDECLSHAVVAYSEADPESCVSVSSSGKR